MCTYAVELHRAAFKLKHSMAACGSLTVVGIAILLVQAATVLLKHKAPN